MNTIYKENKKTSVHTVFVADKKTNYTHILSRAMTRLILVFFISSPEHEVLMVSYCGQSMSVVRRASCGVNNCFKSLLLLHLWAN